MINVISYVLICEIALRLHKSISVAQLLSYSLSISLSVFFSLSRLIAACIVYSVCYRFWLLSKCKTHIVHTQEIWWFPMKVLCTIMNAIDKIMLLLLWTTIAARTHMPNTCCYTAHKTQYVIKLQFCDSQFSIYILLVFFYLQYDCVRNDMCRTLVCR